MPEDQERRQREVEKVIFKTDEGESLKIIVKYVGPRTGGILPGVAEVLSGLADAMAEVEHQK